MWAPLEFVLVLTSSVRLWHRMVLVRRGPRLFMSLRVSCVTILGLLHIAVLSRTVIPTPIIRMG